MLDFKDFFHLPQLDALVQQLVVEKHGLILVAGLDPLDVSVDADGVMPSSRATVFRILMHQILASRSPSGAHKPVYAVVVTDADEVVRNPHPFIRRRRGEARVDWLPVRPPQTYADVIVSAAQRRPDVLVIERLDARTAAAALEVARHGLLVLSQLDTVFCGASVASHLLDWGVPESLLAELRWVVTVQRLATLCPHCKQPLPASLARLAELRRRYPDIPWEGPFYKSVGCAQCKDTGWQDSLMVFDVLRVEGGPQALLEQPSQLPMEEYVLRLAGLGHLSWGQALGFQTAQLRRVYGLLAASERARAESNAALERKLAQLEAAHVVLQHRTEALISLQGVSQTLATLTSVDDLAARMCRCTCDLCGADRAMLYFFLPDGTAEILAVSGWEAQLVGQRLPVAQVMGAGVTQAEPSSFSACPPGLPQERAKLESARLRAGLRVPLVAQHEVLGLMIIHTTQKPEFAPGEVAMLQAFANQAAVALQRAGLIDALRDKIAQLEAARAELLEKEFIKDTFGRLVDPRVRDHLLSGHIELGGELKEATILFSDIRDFTPMSERMKPDRVVVWLNRYFEKMSQCIDDEGGVVNKYIGDAILAVFGVPLGLQGHADAAVRAALKMRGIRDALNQQLEREGQPVLRTGVGIHTGAVLAGNIGSSARMEYTVIGDTVNLAARIEKLCKTIGRDLILSEATALQLGAAFDPVYLDTVRVQGKAQPIRVFGL